MHAVLPTKDSGAMPVLKSTRGGGSGNYAPLPSAAAEGTPLGDLHDDLMAEEVDFDLPDGAVLGSDSAAAAAAAHVAETFAATTNVEVDQEGITAAPDFLNDDMGSSLLAGGGEDLQPGGATMTVAAAATAVAASGSVLDSMTLKELRRLAEQKGISGSKQMKKHELIEAIRNSKTAVTPFDISDGVLTLE
jgi:hypothetical protein